jgi:hypothetical protein
MAYTLGQAAKATAKSKTTILRAIESGKVSATKNEHGEWVIDPAELHRVYEPAEQGNGSDGVPPVTGEVTSNIVLSALENRELKARLEAAEERLRDAQDQIADLRKRLDAEGEERRALTRILTDQREREATQPAGWWARFTGTGRRRSGR